MNRGVNIYMVSQEQNYAVPLSYEIVICEH